MLFDPRTTGQDLAANGIDWQPARNAIAGRRTTHDFLTLPDVSGAVSGNAKLKWRTDREVAALVGSHFEAGYLNPSDVKTFNGAGDAMAQAFFAWVARRCGAFQRIRFTPVLFDVPAVRDQIMYLDNEGEFEVTSPLYLGIETEEDHVFVIEERAAALAAAHPRLLASALILINRASFRTLVMRTPDDFLSLFAQWHWDGDPWCTDDDAVDMLKERFGEDTEEFHHFLPSVVRDELCPKGMEIGRYDMRRHRWRTFSALGITELRRLAWTQTGWIRNLCAELEQLTLLLASAGKRPLFDWSFRPETVYAATSIAASDDEHVTDVLDTHYNYFSNGGDGSLFHGFIALATSPDDIRRQYADLSLGFSMLRHVDRVAALITRDPAGGSQ
ncbi:PRTRC system protein F [Paraburkholderia sp. IW21]|uniref:PRTRC system protein F n=1 Tax=Paraburkholderia sp. IW21 TaxID=3242488 RepID=UPI003522E37D